MIAQRHEHHRQRPARHLPQRGSRAELSIESPIDCPNARSANAPIDSVPAVTVSEKRESVLVQGRPILLDAVDAVESALDLSEERASR